MLLLVVLAGPHFPESWRPLPIAPLQAGLMPKPPGTLAERPVFKGPQQLDNL